ncbi:phosphate-starvation-inducible PsiE family protein [Gilvimarinus algae]|uniref:Phosphate-starvation-inducible PsiE family protein n=1 Tax=Gilvimarinus algae TaxID=3058037 RepID=A0ABT8TIX8_9GAMM|nr:phosphate-starvation-inducible PsiE family protein [Gilvimarinus sp. SDUM040014]MDO3384049.1 phosphate-starvation-inducible PsiE family protein [Gilvimarinus sp. SDUM040014]
MMTDKPQPRSETTEKRHELHQELPVDFPDTYFRTLHHVIRFAIRVLAFLMVLVILWGVVDVVYIIYERLITAPVLLLNINDIFYTFGAFMAVLIAVEIFINIRLYLGTNVFPVQLVVATALMAIARKVIVLDFDALTPMYLLGIAATTLALGITYWLLRRDTTYDHSE